MAHVTASLLQIYQDILGLQFVELHTTNKWHDEVRLFLVKDKSSEETLGYFYLDLFPRPGKFGHAAAFPFILGCDMSQGYVGFGKNRMSWFHFNFFFFFTSS